MKSILQLHRNFCQHPGRGLSWLAENQADALEKDLWKGESKIKNYDDGKLFSGIKKSEIVRRGCLSHTFSLVLQELKNPSVI